LLLKEGVGLLLSIFGIVVCFNTISLERHRLSKIEPLLR